MDYSVCDVASADALLARLNADHQRFADLLDLLQASLVKLRVSAGGSPDPELVRCFVTSLRDYGGGGHHKIEEVVFDTLARSGVELEVEGAIWGLRNDHERLESRAAQLLADLEKLLSGTIGDAALLVRIVDFCQYERYHMRMESELVFPAIREKLQSAAWEPVRRRLEAALGQPSPPRP